MLTFLFSLFYVTGEFHGFLHRSRTVFFNRSRLRRRRSSFLNSLASKSYGLSAFNNFYELVTLCDIRRTRRGSTFTKQKTVKVDFLYFWDVTVRILSSRTTYLAHSNQVTREAHQFVCHENI